MQDYLERGMDADGGSFGRRSWWLDLAGRVVEGPVPEFARLHGWVDEGGGQGRIHGVAMPGTLLLDRLEARYPGVRWFVEEDNASEAA